MTPEQRAAMQAALDALEQLQGGCTDHDDGTVEAITVWCPEVIDQLRAALAQQESDPVGALGMPVNGPVSSPTLRECKGIPRVGCDYLAACDTVCNKCGEVHRHSQMVAKLTTEEVARAPLTDKDMLDCIHEAGTYGSVTLTYDSGPYEVTNLTIAAITLIRIVERKVRGEE